MKKHANYLALVLMLAAMALMYSGIKSVLGIFMSNELSWVGLSLLLTYLTYDLIVKFTTGIKK